MDLVNILWYKWKSRSYFLVFQRPALHFSSHSQWSLHHVSPPLASFTNPYFSLHSFSSAHLQIDTSWDSKENHYTILVSIDCCACLFIYSCNLQYSRNIAHPSFSYTHTVTHTQRPGDNLSRHLYPHHLCSSFKKRKRGSEKVLAKIAMSAKRQRGREGNERESDERKAERKCHIRSGWENMGATKWGR